MGNRAGLWSYRRRKASLFCCTRDCAGPGFRPRKGAHGILLRAPPPAWPLWSTGIDTVPPASGTQHPSRPARGHAVQPCKAGGKRLRPAPVDRRRRNALRSQVRHRPPRPLFAIELIHAYSLVHDDLPAWTTTTCAAAAPPATRLWRSPRASSPATRCSPAFEVLARKTRCPSRCMALAMPGSRHRRGHTRMVGGQAMDLLPRKPEPGPPHWNACTAQDRRDDLRQRWSGRLLAGAPTTDA